MNSLTKSLTKDLKLLLKKFPNKASINLYDAKEYMSKTLNISIDLLEDNLIHNYLKQKGYKEIVKNTKKIEIKEQKINSQKVNTKKNNFDIDSFDLDMDLDNLLDFDLSSDDDSFNSIDIEKVDINYKNNTYSNNKELLSEHAKTKNPILVEELMFNNKSLVHKYASFYNRMIANNSSLEEDDLVQAGMVGLYKAIYKYNLEKGTQFSTYAVFWIKQAISREIMDNGNVVRLPVHLGQDLLKLNRLESESMFNLGYVDMEYVCEKMNITESKYNSLKEVDYKFSKMRSIDIVVNEESADTSIIDLLDSKNALVNLSDDFLDPMEISIKNIFSQNLLKCLDNLTEKERDILLLRFGFIDGIPHTLEDIGTRYNVTRERIRQIESKALKKLRRSKSIRQLIKDEDDKQKNNKKKMNIIHKKTNSNKNNTLSKKVTNTGSNNNSKVVKKVSAQVSSISVSKVTKGVSNSVSSSNNLKTSSNVNNTASLKTNLNNAKKNTKVSNANGNLKTPKKITISSSCSNNFKTSNKKSINTPKKMGTVKNTQHDNVNKSTMVCPLPTSSKKALEKYNVNSFKKEVSKEFFNKLKSKYNGEYLLAEEYFQLSLSVKLYHTKCGSEFYTESSTLLSKRPPCPVCEYKEYIASKKK